MTKYIIYQIKKEGCDFIYIGSTINFRNRKYLHKCDCNKETRKSYNLLLYKTIRENEGWENWNMIPIEEYECETRLQALIREQYWIELKQANLNSYKAYTDEIQQKEYQKEYYKINADKKKEYLKEYYEHNADKIKQHQKEYYEHNADQRKEYSKQYYEHNADQRKEYNKQYYEKTKIKKEVSAVLNDILDTIDLGI